jgi:hypothetical protein
MKYSAKANAEKAGTHLLHLFALSVLAVAQPLFDLLSRGAEFFVAHRSTPGDLLWISAILCFGPMIVLLLSERLVALVHKPSGRAIRLLSIALLLSLFTLPLLKNLAGRHQGGWILPGGILLGGAMAAAYRRFSPLRRLLSVLALLVLAFPLLFLFASPVSELLWAKPNVAPETNPATDIDSAPEVAGTIKAPVIFLVLDELALTTLMDAERNIDAIRYPNFATLAATSTWYRNATTVAIDTVSAVPALLTGRYPDSPAHRGPVPRLPTARSYPESLFSLLAKTHDPHIFESVTRLCPDLLCLEERPESKNRLLATLVDLGVLYLHLLLPEPINQRLPPVSTTWGGFIGATFFAGEKASRETLFESFLASIEPGPEPPFCFLHSMLPHIPWEYLPSGRRYGPRDASHLPHGLGEKEWELWDEDPWHSIQGLQRYLLQLGFVDHLLGRMIERLRSTGLWDSSVVIVVADHGLSFRPGDRRRPLTVSNAQDILPIPLFIKSPGQTSGQVDERSVETIDILPTLAKLLDLELPWPVDGHDLLAGEHSYRSEKVVYRAEGKVKISLPDPAQAKYKSLRRMLDLFGSGNEPPGLYGIGRRPELLGQPVKALLSGPATGCKIHLAAASLTEPSATEAPLLPAHLVGTLTTPEQRRPLQLAVAVDGVIRALTYTYEQGQRTHFSAMLPESALDNPSPKLSFYLLRSTEGRDRDPSKAEAMDIAQSVMLSLCSQ